jgi:hypothetical protein
MHIKPSIIALFANGLLHLGLEVNYNYNPLKWVEDEI